MEFSIWKVCIYPMRRREKSEQAAGYIEDMEEMAGELSFPYSTNNPIADILIGNKLGIAENMGIDVSCSLVLDIL